MIAVEGLSKTWPDNGVLACDAVSVTFAAGEVVALLGENGAGKSTLVSLMAGTLRPDSGRVVIDGQPCPPEQRLARGIALVPQHAPFAADLTLWEHAVLGAEGSLWLGAARRRALQAELRDQAARWGFTLDWNLSARRAGPLALQRATLAALFRRRPRLLILDEPTATLPAPEAAALLGALAAWCRNEDTAVLLITHKLPEALAWADRIVVMRQGRLTAERRPQATSLEDLGRLLFPGSDVGAGGAAPAPPLNPDAPVVFATRGTRADFELRAGEVLGLTSLRGEGWEALEDELTGMSSLPAGCLHLDGSDVTNLGIAGLRRRGLSYVPSDRLGRGSSPESGLASNLIPYRATELSRRGLLRRRRVRAWFSGLKERYGLAGQAGQRLVTLSGGNIQKLILAREIEHGPKVLVLAEPGWGLDREGRRLLADLVRQTAAQGTAVLWLTSEPQDLFDVCTRIGALHGGRLRDLRPQAEWTPEALGRVLLGLKA